MNGKICGQPQNQSPFALVKTNEGDLRRRKCLIGQSMAARSWVSIQA